MYQPRSILIQQSSTIIKYDILTYPFPFLYSFEKTGMAYDTATTRAWNNHNKGKLWQDIRDKVTAESND